MNHNVILLVVVCIATVTAAGCMGLPAANFDTPSSSPAASLSDGPMRLQPESGMSYGDSGAPLPVPTNVPAYAAGQSGSGSSSSDSKIIKTALLTIEVQNVTGSVEYLKSLAAGKGGYISSTNVQKDYNNRLFGSVVIRVPAPEFENTLAGVQAMGTVRSLSTQGQDVTEEYVDLQAQKTSYQNQLAQYNEIMKKAVKVDDVITVQQQIDRVQTQLNRLEGRLKYLDSRIELSTITVNLQEPEPVGGESGHNFVSTINAGLSGFVGMIDAVIIIFFTLLPLLIIGGIGYGIYRWYKARKVVDLPKEPEKK
ncbi:MAG: DUF4349 domain-containing protein [Methanoregula sp.]|nr:DUF4349 domain-containing protein [Methanoregula sp.]